MMAEDAAQLMTLDEIEAWWLAHPGATAVTRSAEACAVALPLAARYPGVEICPGVDLMAGFALFNENGPDEYTLPLPRDVDELARRFDDLAGSPVAPDLGLRPIGSAAIVALIRAIKGAT